MAEIRPATEADIDAILALYDQLVTDTSPAESDRQPTPDDYQHVFTQINTMPGCELLVAEETGEVIGTMVLIIAPNLSHRALPWAIIENMVVSEPVQRRGVGRQMIDYAITRASESGCYKVQLLSSNFRSGAHRFYQSLGFEASARGFRLYLPPSTPPSA